MSRFILRHSGAGTTLADLTEGLRSAAGVKVLDSSSKMLLLEGSKPAIESAMRDISGWQLVPESWTPLPDSRAKTRP